MDGGQDDRGREEARFSELRRTRVFFRGAILFTEFYFHFLLFSSFNFFQSTFEIIFFSPRVIIPI
jgi:hypothetical protein